MENRIVSILINLDGDIIVTYADGTTQNLGPADGLDPESILAQCQAAQAAAAEAAAAAVAAVESIPEDYTEIAEQVDVNTVDIASMQAAITDLYDPAVITWEQGTYSSNTGGPITATNRIRSVFYTNGAESLYIADGYRYIIYAWDHDYNFIGVWNGSEWIITINARWLTDSLNFVDIPGADNYYLHFVISKSDNADITPDEGSNVIIRYRKEKTNTDAFIDAFGSGTMTVQTDKTAFTAKTATNASGETIYNGNSASTDFIPVYQGYKIHGTFTPDNEKISTNWYHYISFYDATKTFISRIGGQRIREITGYAPANAAFLKVSLTYINTGALQAYVLKQTASASGISPKNKWYILGDSISAGYYSLTKSMADAAGLSFTYTSPVTTESGEETGSVWDSTLQHNYWGYANEWKLKREIVGLASPAQGFLKTNNSSKNGINVISENSFSDAGLITVAWGFNDWHYNMPRGNHDLIDPAVLYPDENYDITQLTTINHAIWFCLGELIRKAPDATIIIQTPMNGWAYGGDFASDWAINTEKSSSGTLQNVHDDIVYWANYYGLQILEMTFNNSTVNRSNIKTTLIDGSHPSDAAHKQLGRKVAVMLQYI